MSAPTPISQDPSDIGQEYLGVSPPAIGSVNRKASPASHVHRVFASSSEIIGFGRMAKIAYSLAPGGSSGDPFAYLYSQLPMTIPSVWTAECWLAAPNAQQANLVMIGWSAANGNVPYPNLYAKHAMGFNMNSGAFTYGTGYWGGGVNNGNHMPVLSSSPTHYFVQMDASGTMWYGANGTIIGIAVPKPSGGLIYTNGFPFFMMSNYYNNKAWECDLDEVRFSSVLRYPTSGTTYQVPADPFNPDADTLVLWHLDDIPYGQFLSGGGGALDVFIPAAITTADATINAHKGIFAIANVQFPGNLITFSGENSDVTAGSGSGAAATVESIQGQTGNFLLVDGRGNVLPVDSSTGAQEITVSGGPLAHTYEQEITVTTGQTVLTYTPTTSGLFRISFYFRVITAATDVTVTVTTTDATGAQTWDVLPLTSEAVGSYQLDSITVGATAGDAIDVVVTAGTANQVYFSSSIEAG